MVAVPELRYVKRLLYRRAPQSPAAPPPPPTTTTTTETTTTTTTVPLLLLLGLLFLLLAFSNTGVLDCFHLRALPIRLVGLATTTASVAFTAEGLWGVFRRGMPNFGSGSMAKDSVLGPSGNEKLSEKTHSCHRFFDKYCKTPKPHSAAPSNPRSSITS